MAPDPDELPCPSFSPRANTHAASTSASQASLPTDYAGASPLTNSFGSFSSFTLLQAPGTRQALSSYQTPTALQGLIPNQAPPNSQYDPATALFQPIQYAHVPLFHPAPQFGFRTAQILTSSPRYSLISYPR
jgi:hypothetical protein